MDAGAAELVRPSVRHSQPALAWTRAPECGPSDGGVGQRHVHRAAVPPVVAHQRGALRGARTSAAIRGACTHRGTEAGAGAAALRAGSRPRGNVRTRCRHARRSRLADVLPHVGFARMRHDTAGAPPADAAGRGRRPRPVHGARSRAQCAGLHRISHHAAGQWRGEMDRAPGRVGPRTGHRPDPLFRRRLRHHRAATCGTGPCAKARRVFA